MALRPSQTPTTMAPSHKAAVDIMAEATQAAFALQASSDSGHVSSYKVH